MSFIPSGLLKIGRLALRQEGSFWNAYYALPDTMKGSILLGSIHLGAIIDRPERKEQFMEMMRQVLGDAIEQGTGTRPEWPTPPQPAPEHERGGHG